MKEKVTENEKLAMEDSPMEGVTLVKENTPVAREESTLPVGRPLPYQLRRHHQEVGSWNRKASSMAINTGRKPPVRY